MTTAPTEGTPGTWCGDCLMHNKRLPCPDCSTSMTPLFTSWTANELEAVSVAECDRRVDAAVKAERDRCVTAIRDAFTKYAGLGRQWERDAVRAALAAIEHPDATGDTPRSTP